MTQDNNADPTEPNPNPNGPPGKKRRRWLWIAPLLLVLLIAAVLLLAPTILSTDAARNYIVDKINTQVLNGHLEVKEWSFSWSGGFTIKNIELKDASDSHVLSIGELSSELKLLSALTGNINLGEVQVNGVDFNLRRDKQGRLNIATLLKPGPNPDQPPGKLPNVNNTVIHLNKVEGTFEDDSGPTQVLANVLELDGSVKIADINKPMETSIAIKGNLNHQTDADLKLDGTIAAITGNQVDVSHLSGRQTVEVTAVDNSPGDARAVDFEAHADVNLGGPLGATVPSFQIVRGIFDLHRAQDQGLLNLAAGQWIEANGVRLNSGKVTLAGTGKIDESGISFDSPLSVHLDPIDMSMKDQVGGVQTAHLPATDLAVSGSSAQHNISAKLLMGTPGNPLLAVELAADATIGASSVDVPRIQLSRCDGDLPGLQAAFGPALALFLPPPPVSDPAHPPQPSFLQLVSQNIVTIPSGKFSATLAGSYVNNKLTLTNPAAIKIQSLTLQQGGAPTAITGMNLDASISGAADLSNQSLLVDKSTPLAITLRNPDALTLTLIGKITDLPGKRQMDGVTLDLSYDLAQLWPIVKTFLSPSQQQQLADMVISGKQHRVLVMSGSYPAGEPFNQAIAALKASGAIRVDNLSTHGVAIQNEEIPVTLQDGVLRTVYAGQPEGSNAPKPAACNGGTLDVGVWSLDLKSDPMILSMPGTDAQHPHALLKNVSLNSTMAQSFLGNFLAIPLFGSDTTVSQGNVDVNIYQAQNLPLSSALLQESPQNKAQADVKPVIRNLMVGGGIWSVLGVTNNNPLTIDKADLQLAGGKIAQDIYVNVNKTQAIHLSGSVGLQTMQFEPMNIGLPSSMLSANQVPDRSLLNYFPDEISVPVEGNVSSPQVRLDKVVPQLLQSAIQKAAGQTLLGNLTHQNNQTGPPTSQPSNPLNDLLQGFGQPKSKKKQGN